MICFAGEPQEEAQVEGVVDADAGPLSGTEEELEHDQLHASRLLREMADDLRDFAMMAEATASIRRRLIAADGRQPLSSTSPASAQTPWSSGGALQEAITRSGATDEEDEVPPSETSAEVSLQVALLGESLLQLPFEEALRRCGALRRHMAKARQEEQQEGEEEGTAEEEFRSEWHADAPQELRTVLTQLLSEDVAAGPLDYAAADPLGQSMVAELDPSIGSIPPFRLDPRLRSRL